MVHVMIKFVTTFFVVLFAAIPALAAPAAARPTDAEFLRPQANRRVVRPTDAEFLGTTERQCFTQHSPWLRWPHCRWFVAVRRRARPTDAGFLAPASAATAALN
ncbi:uncharacterized protein C8Q71DRAFT_489097 [Rhodofomes roseus]|uniref:Secreted protein n=1 Tax=Rhodofomes roseus TaxID=34475 RepID=A0ABQ8KMH4_9APHY|nr:uncharacterized protein C8Q71DRAFT_489097 [Rhodofomes roseus]KAH9838986.1 hypothetical protein C8Q71DRAFT_489097 [Rhodofomes roseus]